MATPNFCDPCTEEGKNSKAIKYCTDCEEKFCENVYDLIFVLKNSSLTM